MSKIKFSVAFSSGEDTDYPADELNAHSPHTKGWQSPRFCDYPQEIGLEMDERSQLTRIQILSHQSKIASKMELFIGDGPNYEEARFERLGYLSLNNNQRSNYQARELKSVYINCTGRFLRLFIHRCYINKYNLFNQVGIIAINLIGTPAVESPGRMGAAALPAPKHKPTAMDDISFDMNYDKETARRIREIAAAKEHAVSVEDYDTAKRLKGAEAELRAIGGQIAELEVAKRQAVEVEDYDRAKSLKAEIDVLRREIDAKLQPYLHDAGHDSYRSPPYGGQGSGGGGPVGFVDRDETPVPAQANRLMEGSPAGAQAASYAATYDEDAPISVRGRGAGDVDERRPKSREIKAVAYGEGQEREGGRDEEQMANERPEGEGAKSAGWQGPGPHPLEGVPNHEELPVPEPLGKVTGVEVSELQTLGTLLGEYVLRCLFSKTWTLRDAALYKVKLLLRDMAFPEALPSLVNVLKIGIDDKIAQVYMSSLLLVDNVLEAARAAGMKRSQVAPLVEPISALLIVKLGDGQARIRDAALTSLQSISRSPVAGPASIAHHALRKLPKKQSTAWRPLHARLQLLKALVQMSGFGQASGLTADGVMGFAKEHNAYVHSSAEVREAAKDLTVAVYERIGEGVMKYIGEENLLRKKQLEEYRDCFDRTTAGQDGDDRASPVGEKPLSPPARSARSAGSASARGAAAAAAASKPSPKRTPRSPKGREVDESGDLDEHADLTCQFCGKYDAIFTDDALDLHYFQDCPMLTRCRECGQVIEIMSMAEHLLTECDAKDQYEECPKSGLAVKKGEMKAWKEGPNYKAKPSASATRCPLCFHDIRPNAEEGLKAHFMRKCTANPRRPSAADRPARK